MSKIVDIKYVSGRRAEAIEAETKKNEVLMKIAEAHYAKFRATSSYNASVSIEDWVRGMGGREFAVLFPSEEVRRLKELAKQAGMAIPEIQKEVSLEQKILALLKDGWVLKGELTYGMNTGWVQTLVKYETVEEPVDLLGDAC